MRGLTILESGGATRRINRRILNPDQDGERQGWRGGKGHDVHTGMTHSIVARQECDIG
jgi:hypothetical protein